MKYITRRNFLANVSVGAAGLWISASSAVAAERDEELDGFVRARMESAHIPGLSLAIVRDGQLAGATSYGYANLAQNRPMHPDTLMNVASVTKTLTCLAIMQLWERKKFGLDTDVNRYLSFPVRNGGYPDVPVTFRQLLTHTSSIADGPAYDESYACGDSRIPLQQWLKDNLTFHAWKPGAQFQYCNTGYGLLGHLVETLSGMSYSDYMLTRVFAPLEMSHSRILLAGMDPQSHATPYTYVTNGDVSNVKLRDPAWTPPDDRSGGVQVPHCLYSWATPPDGLARTSAIELSRMLRTISNRGMLDGRRVLQSATISQIFSDQHVPVVGTPSTTIHGLTWLGYQGPLGPEMVWVHSGEDPGISTFIAFRPKDRLGLVVLMNSGGASTTAIELTRYLLAQ
jgi:CubicO group peptidase (beta-lactamase class C family)